MESPAETLATWTAPQCRFTIEYAPRVIDDIRLAVIDAFFSLPRGGAEIGGILLGSYEKDCLTILGSVALDCEHAFGPSFVLSPQDLAKLEQQLAGLPRSGDARPVGWYHSHTRSEVFLSDADLEVYRRFFPEPWQVALVLRPHTLEPARAGFFFREADGSVHASASYREFVLDPLPVQPIPAPNPPAAAPPFAPAPPVFTPTPPPAARRAPVVQMPIVEAPPKIETPLAAPERKPVSPPIVHLEQSRFSTAPPVTPPAPPPAASETKPASVLPAKQLEPPKFGMEPQPGNWRRWGILAVLAGLVLGAAGYQSRNRWLPRGPAPPQVAGPVTPAPAGLGLTAVDSGGQLMIRWDHNSPAIRKGTGALLMIVDGAGVPHALGVDAAHLKTGTFTYGRESGQVDVTLTVHQPDGSEIREVATYLGQPPRKPAGDPAARKKREEDPADKAAKPQTGPETPEERNKKLEKSLEDMRLEMRRKRMENQIPDTGKKK